MEMEKLPSNYEPSYPVVYAPGVRETIATLTQKYIKEIERIYRLMNDNNDNINSNLDDLLDELKKQIQDLIDELTKGDTIVNEAGKTTGSLTIQENGTELGKFNGSKDITVNITIEGLLKLPKDPNKVLNGNGEWVEYTARNSVVILTGSILSQETIPLPSGFTQEQCKWIVSMRDSQRYSFQSVQEILKIRCWADGNRKVISQIYHTWSGSGESGNGGGSEWLNGYANYIIIGVK